MLLPTFLLFLIFSQVYCEIKEFRRLTKHYKCLNDYYPCTNEKVKRENIADQEILWDSDPFHPPYDPQWYTSKVVLDGPDWADPDMNSFWFQSRPEWNLNNGQTYNRACGSHLYLVNGSFPLNPIGRTGLRGRGLLGRWGPNHEAHAIIARYKRDTFHHIIYDQKRDKPIFEFLTVKRADADLWSIPGRFLRGKERIKLALKKCIIEECFNNLKNFAESTSKNVLRKVTKMLTEGELIYKGYVDDPRNTDNAWVSTTAMLFFDDFSNATIGLNFVPGNNILDVKWMNAKEIHDIEFYANHEHFVKDSVLHLGGHYEKTDSDEERKKNVKHYDDNVSSKYPSKSIEDDTPGNSAKRAAMYSSGFGSLNIT